MLITFALTAMCLSSPVSGPIISVYSPHGQYAGHWGVDYAADPGELVVAPVSGRVSFAGSVAGMNSVTIQPLTGYKVSVSYLREISTTSGAWLARGIPLGTAGMAHGRGGVHLSVRIDDKYVDPAGHMGCRNTDITRALRLVTPPQPYPRRRANRHPWRNIRPDSSRAHGGSDGRRIAGRPRPDSVHAGRRPVAEDRS